MGVIDLESYRLLLKLNTNKKHPDIIVDILISIIEELGKYEKAVVLQILHEKYFDSIFEDGELD